MSKYHFHILTFCFTFGWSSYANAQLDFLLEKSVDIAKTAAIADSAADLIGELDPESELKVGLESVRNTQDNLAADAASARYLSAETRSLLMGPRWSQNRLENNIRQTTSYVRRAKRMLVLLAALGPEGVSASAGIETAASLNEIQKNQQVMILQNSQLLNRQLSKEVEEANVWTRFVDKQRAQRSSPQQQSDSQSLRMR